MRVCKDLLKRVSDFLDPTNETALICEQVSTITRSGEPIPMVLLCSEFFLRLLRWDNAFEKPKIVFHRMWLDIVSVSVASERLTINFTKNVTLVFHGANVVPIAAAIKSYMMRFLHEKELPEFRTTEELVAKGKFSPVLKMLLQYVALGGHLVPGCCDKVFKFFEQKPTSIHLSTFAFMGQRLGPLFRTLAWITSLKQLVIDVDVTDQIGTPLQKFVVDPGTVTRIVFAAQILCPLDDVVRAMTPKILRVKFNGKSLGVFGVKTLVALMKAKKVKDIALCNAFSKGDEDLFANEVKTAGVPLEASSLRLLHNRDIDVTKLVPCVKKIFSLHVFDCDVHITSLFSVLQGIEIVQIDLSGTHFTEPLPEFEWPATLKIVRFERCVWLFESLVKAFEKCLPRKLSVAMGHASFRTPKWSLFHELLNKTESSELIGLEWDENPLQPEMLQFLVKCPHIRELSINGCALGIGCATALASVIASSTSLTILKFNATGASNAMGPSDALEIINAFRRNQSLVEIEMDGHMIGNHNLSLLTYTLLENLRIKSFQYDFAGITDMKQFFKFAEELSVRGVALEMSWPKKLIGDALANRQITQDDIAQARFSFSLMKKGNRRVRKPSQMASPPPIQIKRSRVEQRAAQQARARTRTRSAMDQPVHVAVVKQTTESENTEPSSPMRQFVPHFQKTKLSVHVGRKRLHSLTIEENEPLSPREEGTIPLAELTKDQDDIDEELHILRLSSNLMQLVSEDEADEDL